jgi:hypothetical protein
MTRSILASLLVVSAVTVACGGSPTSPSSPSTPYTPPAPTTGTLRVTLDSTCKDFPWKTASADVYVDGQYMNVVATGGSVDQTVSIGTHMVEARNYNTVTHLVAWKWGPVSIMVPAAGASQLFFCS